MALIPSKIEVTPRMPSVSVVIASKVGSPFIEQCLESIKNEVMTLGAETLVVTPSSEAYSRRIAQDFPWARVIRVQDVTKVPALRRRGVQEATGEYVAVIEEHCSAGPDWLRAALTAHSTGEWAAVGGAISDYDYSRLRDWVVYFVEYNGALPPVPSGETADLNDANIVYRRRVLLDHLALLDDGYWPMTLHPTLAANGHKLLSVPAMVVHHRGPFDFRYYLHQRFLFSRAFAGVRAQAQSPMRRLAYLVAAPMIPALLLMRMTRTVFRKRCRVPHFIRALPLTVAALVVLVAGEWIGCLLGPGDALSEVE
jgi:glycosyltransferase involved in cell wall biosynthesis